MSTASQSQSQTLRASLRPSIPSRSHSQALSQLTDEWESDNKDSISSTASSLSFKSDSDSSSSSSDDNNQQQKGKKRTKKAKDKKKKKRKRKKRGPWLSDDDKKIVL
jgi:hypothetical protein